MAATRIASPHDDETALRPQHDEDPAESGGVLSYRASMRHGYREMGLG
jgi:hypothetical protein